MRFTYCLIALGLSCAMPVLADSRAVRSPNLEFEFGSGDTYVAGDRDSNGYRFAGVATLPIVGYLGAALEGSYARTTVGRAFSRQTGVAPSDSPPAADVDNLSGAATLFARNPRIGRIGAYYGAGRTRLQGDAAFVDSGENTLTTRTYGASGELYISRLTFGASRDHTTLDGSETTFDSADFTGSVYPADNVRLSVSVGGLDRDKTYGVALDYQPQILTDAMSLLVNYVRETREIESHFVMLGFSYRFGTQGDLIAIDRQYR